MKRLLFLLIGGLGVMTAPMQGATAETAPITDAVIVADHYRSVLQREEYRQEPSFDFLSQLGHWVVTVLQSLQDSFRHYEYSGQLIRLSYALMGTILALGVISLLYWGLKLFRLRYLLAKPASEKTVGERYYDVPESFEVGIRHAVAAQLWTTALLLSWRQFLSLLERHELVPADRTRTNWEYLEQLQATSIPAPTRELCHELVLRYDRYIYGAQPVTPEDWAQWNASLFALVRTLKLDRPIPASNAS
ncbi:MAG: hypothetical protein B9S32_05400 [Verrucomicrobia bacterium Tous-C9LFEB]|nr:MAG: hypothetical protein B9S32_05400 [Verrucomicrobia bacterium Tous-C9LFEB]